MSEAPTKHAIPIGIPDIVEVLRGVRDGYKELQGAEHMDETQFVWVGVELRIYRKAVKILEKLEAT